MKHVETGQSVEELKEAINKLLFEDDVYFNEMMYLVQRDCSEFIKEEFALFKHSTSTEDYIISSPKTNRRSKDKPSSFRNIDDMLDIYFKEIFGWKPRTEGVFCNPDKDSLIPIGDKYYIFPVDGYKYIWNTKIKSIYSELNKFAQMNYGTNIIKLSEDKEMLKDLFENFSEELEFYDNKDLLYNEKSQVLLGCDKYYMIKLDSLAGIKLKIKYGLDYKNFDIDINAFKEINNEFTQ
jgi:hypothetical protein